MVAPLALTCDIAVGTCDWLAYVVLAYFLID
jgi:hypothetical protein